MKTYLKQNWVRLLVAVGIAIAVCAGTVDPGTALAGGILLDVAPTDLKALEKAMKEAFEKMQEGLQKTQDSILKAERENERQNAVEAKTADDLQKIGTEMRELSANFKISRDQVVEIAQKMATHPVGIGHENVDKTLAQIVIESAQYKSASKSTKMEAVDVGDIHRFLKTQVVNATGQNQPLVPDQRVPGIIFPAPQRLYIRDLLPQVRTTSNLIQFAVEATFTNAAAAQGGGSPAAGEGELKAESAFTFALSNAAVVTIGHWVPASRQVLSDASELQGYLGTRLLYGLKLVEETNLLTGNGATGTINGINNQAAAFNGGVTNATILDTLLRALLQVSLSNYEASAFILHPRDWYEAMLLKDTQGRYLFSDPQSMVQPRLWAKPVVPSQTQTVGRFTAGAFDLGAQIWDREDASVRISENVNDHFIRNMVAILVEERFALTVFRPAAFVYGATANVG